MPPFNNSTSSFISTTVTTQNKTDPEIAQSDIPVPVEVKAKPDFATSESTEPPWYNLQKRSVKEPPKVAPQVSDTEIIQRLYERIILNRPPWFALGVPILLVYSMWLLLTIRWNLWDLSTEGWKMSITMVIGAFVAGSTSLGGGAIAFPVMTLVLHLNSSTGRDFSMMIQSIGMTAATWNILYSRVLVDMTAFKFCSLGGALGVLIGFQWVVPYVPSDFVTMFFVSFWMSFSFSLFITNRRQNRKVVKEIEDVTSRTKLVLTLIGCLGGISTSLTGSGVDICCFALLTTLYSMDESVATPTSVILMGINTVVGVTCKFFLFGGLEVQARALVWFSFPVVVIMAPVGAFVASYLHRKMLALMVYFLTTLQFICAYIVLDLDPVLVLFSAGILTSGALLWLFFAHLGARMAQRKAKDVQAAEIAKAAKPPDLALDILGKETALR